MGKGKWLTALVGTVLTFLAVFGGLGCMASGMELPIDMGLLIWGCLLMALVLSLFWDSRLWLLPLCLGALLVGYWWQEDTLRLSMESLLYRVTDLYDRGYNWGILQWSDRSLLRQDVTPALLALGGPIATVVSLTIVKGQWHWLGAGMALLPLLSCVLLKDTVPAEGYLALLLFAVIVMLMTGHVRRSSHRQANILSLSLSVPLALALGLLFLFCPREGYSMQSGAQKLEQVFLQLFEHAQLPQGPVLTTGDQPRSVNLSNVGKRTKGGDVIMTVRAQEDGPVYLRGCAYDIYDGTSWSSTPGWNASHLLYSSHSGQTKSLTIQTTDVHSVLYFTYAPVGTDLEILGGRIRNEDGLTKYTIEYLDPIAYGPNWDQQADAVGEQQLSEYLQLPESTREGALKILNSKIGISTQASNAGQVWENARQIANWVSRRARYSLRTGKMPAGRDDFALWFLNESDTGYCTHFATATVVLLRAAGIPAQYVTGYLVDAKAGQSVTVTQDNAHAWVEVFINGVGWVVLEPTPAQGTAGIGSTDTPTTPSRPTTPDETTAPEQTVETTAPAQTEETTTPEQTTQSTSATTPGQTTEPFIHPTASATGIAGISGADPGTPARQSFGKVLLWLLGVVCFLLAVVLQWRIRVAVKQRQCRQGHHNRRSLRIWKQLSLACRLAGQTPSDECYWLAQKACFSQHTISAQELHLLKQALNEAHRDLRRHHFLRQLLYTLILAIY